MIKNIWIFIFVISLILLFIYTYFSNTNENFIFEKSNIELIIVKNNNWILIHFNNIENNENKIYKIYKNKFII